MHSNLVVLPTRPWSEALSEASSVASQEWFDYLPSGLPLTAYEPYGEVWFCYFLVDRVSAILSTAIPRTEALYQAWGLIDIYFIVVLEALAIRKPHLWFTQTFWVGQRE